MKLLLKFIKGIVGTIALVLLALIILFKCEEYQCVDNAFKEVDERLGIDSRDYRIQGRAARVFVLQDPSALQKIRLNKRGREKIEKYILHYQDTLNGFSVPESVSRDYKPRFDRPNCMLINSLPEHVSLDIFTEIIEDSEEAYIRMQTSQVERYFEQFCWLGGDFWKIIVDRKKGVIYRQYGSI